MPSRFYTSSIEAARHSSLFVINSNAWGWKWRRQIIRFCTDTSSKIKQARRGRWRWQWWRRRPIQIIIERPKRVKERRTTDTATINTYTPAQIVAIKCTLSSLCALRGFVFHLWCESVRLCLAMAIVLAFCLIVCLHVNVSAREWGKPCITSRETPRSMCWKYKIT